MRKRIGLAVLIAAFIVAIPSAQAKPVRYYVSLGDSLAVGEQPRADGVTVTSSQGYVDQLAQMERGRFPGLQVVKFGCGGERASTIISHSDACFYPGNGSQLSAAAKFIRAHRRQIAFVTIDIGANDVQSCVKNGTIDVPCVSNGVNAVNADLPIVARQLRAAAGSRVKIAGMNYYDPFLQQWLTGSSGQSIAKASLPLATQINTTIANAYKARKIKVADVAAAFQTSDINTMTTLAPFGSIPVDVARICTLTWMCAAPPVGPNIHARPGGYKVIAQTFKKVL